MKLSLCRKSEKSLLRRSAKNGKLNKTLARDMFPFADGFDTLNDDNDGVNDVVNKILEIFKGNPMATIKEAANEAGVTARTIDREIERHKAIGKLKRVDSTRSGHWEAQG